MEIKSKLDELKAKYGKKAIKIIVGIVIVVILFFVGKYYANKKVNDFVNGVKNEWSATIGREIQDNIAKIEQKQEDMDNRFKEDITSLRKKTTSKKEEFKNVINKKDPKQIASYFDNTIDNYVPSK